MNADSELQLGALVAHESFGTVPLRGQDLRRFQLTLGTQEKKGRKKRSESEGAELEDQSGTTFPLAAVSARISDMGPSVEGSAIGTDKIR